jgi:hypothetical protein
MTAAAAVRILIDLIGSFVCSSEERMWCLEKNECFGEKTLEKQERKTKEELKANVR